MQSETVVVGTGHDVATSSDTGTSVEEAVAVLRKALEDESELVREHAAWALAEVGHAEGPCSQAHGVADH